MAEFDEKSIDRISRAVRWVERQQLSRERKATLGEFFPYKAVFLEDVTGQEVFATAYDPETTDPVPSLEHVKFVDEFNVFGGAPAGHELYVWEHNGKLFPLFSPCIQSCEHAGSIDLGSPPTGTVDSAYSHSVSGSGLDSGSFSGSFPAESNLSIDSSGNISGTPDTAGEYFATVAATAPKTGGGGSCTLTAGLLITVEEAE